MGPKTAALIVSSLGAENVIGALNSDGAVAALSQVKGIGRGKAQAIKEEWDGSEGGWRVLVGFSGAVVSCGASRSTL